jgi:hypothetical protein
MDMYLKNYIQVVTILIILLVFSEGCKRDEFTWGEKIGDITYSGNVVFLGREELELLTESSASRMVFSNKTDRLENITSMSILVIGVSEKTPYGLLRKVNSIQMNGSELIIYSSEATLAEAIKEGTIRFHEKMPEKNFKLRYKSDGVSVTNSAKSFDGLAATLEDLEIFSDGSKSARLNGAIGISPEIDITIKIKSNRISEVNLTANLGKIDELTVTSDGALNGKNEIVAAEFIHSPVITDSIVFVPYVRLFCGFDGTISGQVTSGVRQDRNITTGMKYQNQVWSEDPVSHSINFDFINPQVTDNADLEVFSGPEISLLIFGSPLQIAKATGYQTLKAQKTGSPLWSLSIGNEGYNTIKAGILGLNEDHSVKLAIPSSEIGNSDDN